MKRREDLLTRTQAAAYLGKSKSWLAQFPPTDGGPPFLRIGSSVWYLIEDLDQWIYAQRITGGQPLPDTDTDTNKDEECPENPPESPTGNTPSASSSTKNPASGGLKSVSRSRGSRRGGGRLKSGDQRARQIADALRQQDTASTMNSSKPTDKPELKLISGR